LKELCEWCATNATTFADYTATADQWEKMLGEEFVHAEMSDDHGNTVILM